MSRRQHEEEAMLGPYALGALGGPEARAVEAHLEGCVACRAEAYSLREMAAVLGEVPPEAFLDGPPGGGDLVLQRTLRQMRKERAGGSWRRAAVAGLVAAAALAGVFWAGTVTGEDSPADVAAAPTATSTATPPPPPPGTMVASATDSASGARMTVRVTPAAAWVRLHAAVTGLPPGERCTLVVVGRDGSRTPAGSWVVGSGEHAGEGKGASLDGSAAVAPQDVREVVVENDTGRRFVTVPLMT